MNVGIIFTYKNRRTHIAHKVVSFLSLSFHLLPPYCLSPSVISCFLMEACHCAGSIWASGNNLAKYQFVSDLFISVAYFSIPLELVYLAKKTSLAPYRRILLQFGAFIVLCGATHFISLWGFSGYTETVDTIQAVTKVLCAIVSCATAISLIGMMRDFLAYKLEWYLKNKASELDSEKGLVKNQESTGKTEY